MKNISILLITNQLLGQSEEERQRLNLQIEAIYTFLGLDEVIAHSNRPVRRIPSKGKKETFGIIKIVSTFITPLANKSVYDEIFFETIGPIATSEEKNQLDAAPKIEETAIKKGYLWHYLK